MKSKKFTVKHVLFLAAALIGFQFAALAQVTPVPMASQPGLSYTENFIDIAAWTPAAASASTPTTNGNFSAGVGSAAWRLLFFNSPTVTTFPKQIPDPSKITLPTSTTTNFGYNIVASLNATAGMQKGTQNLGMQVTGTTDSSTSVGIDMYLNFAGVDAGTLSFTAEKMVNTSSTRSASMLVYGSIDGTNWSLIPLGQNVTVDNLSTNTALFTISNVALPANFNNNPNARIRFYVYNGSSTFPAGAGNRPKFLLDNVSVTAVAGCATPISLSITAPTSPQTICAGASVPLAVSATGGPGGAITYAWTTSTAVGVAGLSNSVNSSVTATPSATTVYTLTASAGNCYASTVTTITVNPLPTIVSTPASATVCAGGTQNFSLTGASTYTWSPATDLNVSTGAAVICTPTVSRIYTVTATSAAGCISTKTISVNYISGVSVVFSPSAPIINCTGGSIAITASGASTFVWDSPTATNVSSASTYTANPTTNSIYTVTGAAGSCSGTATIEVLTFNYPLPTISFSPLAPTTCQGSTSTITASGASTYAWTAASTLNTTIGATVQTSNTTGTIYTVTGTDASGCSATGTLLVAYANLPNVTANAVPAILCTGGGSTLSAVSTATSFLWSTGATTTSIPVNPTTSTIYTVFAIDASGCSRSTTAAVSVYTNNAVAFYGFQTAVPNYGYTDSIYNCNTALAYVSPVSFGNQNGTPATSFPTGTGTVTYNNQTASGAGTINAGVSCSANNPIPLNTTTASYFEFSIAPPCGKAITFNGIEFGTRSTTTGPAYIHIATSANNFASAISTSIVGTNSIWNYLAPSFSPVTLINGDSIKIRIYGSGTGNGGANTINWRIDDVRLILSTIAIGPLPVTITSTNTAVCAGSSTTLTASGALNFAWSTSPSLNTLVGSIVTATPTASAIYTVTGTNAAGCTGIATTSITVLPVVNASTSIALCPTALPYTWQAQTITAAGTYTANVVNTNGCTSVDTLHVIVKSTSSNAINVAVCNNALPYSWNGQTLNTTGIYTYTTNNAAGCDSVVTLTFTVNPVVVQNTTAVICHNLLPYSWNGQTINATGAYSFTTLGANGCDSTTILTITVSPNTGTSTTQTVCSASLPYVWNSNNYTTTGVYTNTSLDANGCAKIDTLNLTVNTGTPNVTTSSICSNSLPYVWNSNNYTASGTYTFTTSGACPQVDTLHLTVKQTSSSSVTQTVSSTSLPYSWNGTNYNAAGTYTFTTLNAVGCDSIATLILNVNTIVTTVKISPKVILNGPYKASTGLMNDGLRVANLIPATEPYGSSPYNVAFTHVLGGGETVSPAVLTVTGANAIVDWVFVQLRSAANPAVVVATRSALLQADGDVVSATDGVSPITMSAMPDNYFVSIKHRNHAGVTTATALPLTNTASAIDFTAASTSLYALPAPNNNTLFGGATKMVGTTRTLFAGNCLITSASNNKRIIHYGNNNTISDRNAMFVATGGLSLPTSYSIFDLDFNGVVNYNGVNSDREIMRTNCNSNTANYIIEQCPN